MRHTPIRDQEKRSYAGAFALCAGALLACALWVLVDDLFLRRPWKKYQTQLAWHDIETLAQQIAEGEAQLAEDAAYQKLQVDLQAARGRLHDGDLAARREALLRDIDAVRIRVAEADQELRFVKSELEEARYAYDTALQHGNPTAEAEALIGELDARKTKIGEELREAQANAGRLEGELGALGADVGRLENTLLERRNAVDALYQKLDGITAFNLGVTLPVIGRVALRAPLVPHITQVVLPEFDRSKFDTPLARVDRCMSCHAAIDEKGYEDGQHPLQTHPDRERLLGKHPPEKFGCTPCHGGQGAAVNSPAKAHGEVAFWEHPLLRAEKVQASCIGCHQDVQSLSGAETISRGERLFVELGCHGCHLVAGYDDLPKAGPSLRRLAAKVDHDWLVRWVQNPHEIRPRTRMPNFAFTEDQAISVAAYLLSASAAESEAWLAAHPRPEGLSNSPETVARGKALTELVGCRACHAFSADEIAGTLGENKDIAPNLRAVAAKVGPRWVYHWIKNPRGYSPVARMPSLRLSNGEAGPITAYLMTLGTPARPSRRLARQLKQPERIQAGQRLVRKYGCFGCHDIPGMENESRIGVELSAFGGKVLEELFFGDRADIPRTWDDWTYNKLKKPRVYATRWIEQLMPNFALADTDILALKTFLASRTDARVPVRYHFADGGRSEKIVAGRRVVARYNCTGCHIIEGTGGDVRRLFAGREALAPPNLRGEGGKVQSAWLFRFLKAPASIRPWVHVRMPTFGLSDQETDRLVAYFDSLDRVEIPYVYLDVMQSPHEFLADGRTLTSPEYFNCFSCHQQGVQKPEGPPDGWAPDLAMAHERLNPDWVINWIRDPQKVLPGTKMPSFYPDGPPDILGGDDELQIRALRDYIWSLGS